MKHKKYHYKQANEKSRFGVNRVFFVLFMAMFVVSGFYSFFQNSSEKTVEPNVVTAEIAKEPQYRMDGITPPPEGQFAIANLTDGITPNYTDEKQAPIASLTKLITALVILDRAPIEPGNKGNIITLTAQDEQYYWDYVAIGGTVTAVTAGLQISQYEALQTVLLASSNNMSDTLVDYYFESKEEYVDYANNLLREMGFIHTKVADTTGFSPENVSTPTELLLLGKKSLENPLLAEIVAQNGATVNVAGEIPNYNALINLPYVTGLKPGLTDEAGYCLLFSMDVPNSTGEIVTTIGVVMGMRDTVQYREFISSAYNQVIETIQKG
jgi:serine-type D-Ala-D-Ala carboxypeptidase (penicillin-binding protein 5/6)